MVRKCNRKRGEKGQRWVGKKHQAENLNVHVSDLRRKSSRPIYTLFVDLIQQRLQMELGLVIKQRERCAILILSLQQILHLHIGLSDPVADAQGIITDLDVENADRVGR